MTYMLIFVFTLLSVLFQPDAGVTYYVSPMGDDANPGTIERPWQTINAAANHPGINPGDSIAIMPGTYVEAVKVGVSGAPGRPIVFRAYDPNDPPVLTHSEYDVLTVIDQSHLLFDGLHFANWSCGAVQIRAITQNMTDITIQNSQFEENDSWDVCGLSLHVIVAGTDNPNVEISQITVRNNLLRNVISGKPTAYNENITFMGNVVNSQILDNQIVNGSYIGIDLIGRLYAQGKDDPRYREIGQPRNILIKGNDIQYLKPPEGGGTPIGIYLDSVKGPVVIEDNRIWEASGIYLNGEWNAWKEGTYLEPVRYVIVRRNTVYLEENGAFGLAMGYETWPNNEQCFARAEESVAVHNSFVINGERPNNLFMCAENIAWKNNIFVHEGANEANFHAVYRPTIMAAGLELDGNLYFTSSDRQHYEYPPAEIYPSLSEWIEGTSQDQQSIFADPELNDPKNGDFGVALSSPVIDAGVYLTTAINAGDNTTQLRVEDVRYFSDGFGLQPGDSIRVGSGAAASAANVLKVDYATKTLVLDAPLQWRQGAEVAYHYLGSAPDIGAEEMVTIRPSSLINWLNRLLVAIFS